MQYDINRETPKIFALSSGKIDKYEFLTSEEKLPFHQSKIIEQAKFTYSPLGKTFEKQRKTIEEQARKQVEALKPWKSERNKQDIKSVDEIFPKKRKTIKIKNEIDEIKISEK